jgi:hypothetical protein
MSEGFSNIVSESTHNGELIVIYNGYKMTVVHKGKEEAFREGCTWDKCNSDNPCPPPSVIKLLKIGKKEEFETKSFLCIDCANRIPNKSSLCKLSESQMIEFVGLELYNEIYPNEDDEDCDDEDGEYVEDGEDGNGEDK